MLRLQHVGQAVECEFVAQYDRGHLSARTRRRILLQALVCQTVMAAPAIFIWISCCCCILLQLNFSFDHSRSLAHWPWLHSNAFLQQIADVVRWASRFARWRRPFHGSG
jgi:hypothetical protein